MKNEKTTVLHLMPSLLSPAGTPRKLLSLVQNCNREKFRHVFLLFCNHQDNLSDEIRRAGGIVEEVSRPRNCDIRLLCDIRKVVRKNKVDIINTHFARSDIYGMVAGLLLRTPVIKSVHGIQWNDSKLFIYIDRLLARFRYLTTCNSGASLEAEEKRSHSKKLKVIHNGVVPRECELSNEEPRVFRQKIGIPPDSFLVGHVGGLIELRCQDLIIDAVSILYEKGVDIYCAIAGKGPEENRLKEHAKSLNIADRVRLLGYRDDITKLLSIFDVYVNMATEEGFGIAVVEAMFAGVPVILANSGALPELIVDQESGVLVPPGDVPRLAKALSRLARDSDTRAALARAARKRAKKEFSIGNFVANIENIYLECLRRAHSK